MSAGKADCRKIASRLSRCSALTEDLPSVGVAGTIRLAARQVRRRHRIMVIRDRSTAERIDHRQA
jgi:hypothetical protein